MCKSASGKAFLTQKRPFFLRDSRIIQVSKAKRSTATKASLSVQVINDYGADYAALMSHQSGLPSLPVKSAMMYPAKGVKATALLSTNTAAQSETKAIAS